MPATNSCRNWPNGMPRGSQPWWPWSIRTWWSSPAVICSPVVTNSPAASSPRWPNAPCVPCRWPSGSCGTSRCWPAPASSPTGNSGRSCWRLWAPPPSSRLTGRHRLSLRRRFAVLSCGAGPQRTAALDLAAVLGAALGQPAAVAQRELDGAFGGDPCLQLPHPLQLGVQLRTEQQRHIGDPQPQQEDDHTRQRAVDLVVLG